MINKLQLGEMIIKPSLKQIGMYSDSAYQLFLITAAIESRLGYYLKQITGPALGIYQMEPDTFHDNVVNNLEERDYNGIRLSPAEKENPDTKTLKHRIMDILNVREFPHESRMVWDLKFATLMARVHYSRFSDPLPAYNDFDGLIEYYYKYWGPNRKKTSIYKAKKRASDILLS